MITMQDFMEITEYRITEGDAYTWPCFGPDAEPYSLSAWNGDHKGWSFNIVFDTRTQEVYIAEACDYKHERAYRRVNPLWLKAYRDYGRSQGEYADQAWDGIDFVDLESDDDWIQKALSIRAGEDYDTRVEVPVEFTDQELLTYMKLAHERDQTFNQLVETALRAAIEECALDPEGYRQRMAPKLNRTK